MAVDAGSDLSLNDLLTKPLHSGRPDTFCERFALERFSKHRRRYCGSIEDLSQAVAVALLEWARLQPDPNRLRASEVQRVCEAAVVAEVKSMPAVPLGQDRALVGEDGELLDWNPLEPDDNLTPERVALISSAMESLSLQVGPLASYLIRGRLLFGLSFEELWKRLRVGRRDNNPDPDLSDSHLSRLLGWPPERVYDGQSVAELEQIFTESLFSLRGRFQRGELKVIKRCLEGE